MTTKILSIILLAAIGFTACKKESAAKPVTTQDKLLGKWNLITEVTNDYYGGASHPHNYPFAAGDYMEFKSDGKVIQYNSGSSMTFDYGLIGDTQVWFILPSNLFDLKLLTGTDLQLYNKDVYSPTEYYESTLILKK